MFRRARVRQWTVDRRWRNSHTRQNALVQQHLWCIADIEPNPTEGSAAASSATEENLLVELVETQQIHEQTVEPEVSCACSPWAGVVQGFVSGFVFAALLYVYFAYRQNKRRGLLGSNAIVGYDRTNMCPNWNY